MLYKQLGIYRAQTAGSDAVSLTRSAPIRL